MIFFVLKVFSLVIQIPKDLYVDSRAVHQNNLIQKDAIKHKILQKLKCSLCEQMTRI